ncbi:MAG TPA: metalloregulator ArsR/SmtB family transcription factor [Candidatus Limnocylindrales bacterium]|nr:metalloregulator ArsR/SmtB family transcription factor [Candidatus Limnocylindrales bacterium]
MYNASVRTALDASSEIDRIQVDLIRALAGAHRLQIVHLLRPGPLEVGELARALGLPQATLSANLAAMRAVGLVEAARDGRVVRYRIPDPEILDACDLMRNVIVRRLSALGSLAAAAGGEPASHPDLQVTNP